MMQKIYSSFAEPGMYIARVNDFKGPRFCRVNESGKIQTDTNVGVRLGQTVEIAGSIYVSVGHAFQELHGTGRIAFAELNGYHARVADLAADFVGFYLDCHQFANST